MISKNTLQLLEFDRLLGIISGEGHSEVSKQAVQDIVPFSTQGAVQDRFCLIDDLRGITRRGLSLGLQPFNDIRPLLTRVRPAGSLLDASELSAFLPVLDMAYEISSRMPDMEWLRSLPELTGGLTGQPEILKTIRRSIDPEGNIRDTASVELGRIRKDLRRLEQNIRKKLEEITRDQSVSAFLQDDFITRRAGRWVLPVRMDSKGMVSGVVHDVSKSGETAFVEPLTIISYSNELENLYAEEKAEELRILRDISGRIREKADEIAGEFNILVSLDMLNCIALFADRMRCDIPMLGDTNSIRLVRARHPLLAMTLGRSGSKEVVPLDLQLGGEGTVMVITGSNAGGKTISIKTVGLLQCMALSGIPVPADPASSFPIVDSLLVDMGDEQSIENNLSTFSAHVTNIARILSDANSRSMVLIDELGTGTDPDEGTALACAVLKDLSAAGPLVFATTHLMGIKGFVHRTAGMVNASMEFDKKTLSPLYRLRTGEPGQSHGLEIAAKFGLPDAVIAAAKEMIGGSKIELDSLMADLNEKRAGYEARLKEIDVRQAEVEARERQVREKLFEAEAKKKELLAAAHKEALDIVSSVKRQMHAELEEMKKSEKKELQEKLKEIGQRQKELTQKIAEFEQDEGGLLGIADISVGDSVFVRSLGYDGTVSGIMEKTGRVKVISGSKEILVPVSDLRIKKGRFLAAGKEKTLQQDAHDEMVPSRINLIGLRVDEALSQLEPFLNHASLAGFREVTIIHGYGTGILAKAVRGHLTGHPLVKQFRHGEPAEGAGGVTVVTLG